MRYGTLPFGPSRHGATFVYILRRISEPFGLYKIGSANDIERRISQICQANRIVVELVGYAEVPTRRAEGKLHDKLREYAVGRMHDEDGGSEWFNLDDRALAQALAALAQWSSSCDAWRPQIRINVRGKVVASADRWTEEHDEAPEYGVWVAPVYRRAHLMLRLPRDMAMGGPPMQAVCAQRIRKFPSDLASVLQSGVVRCRSCFRTYEEPKTFDDWMSKANCRLDRDTAWVETANGWIVAPRLAA